IVDCCPRHVMKNVDGRVMVDDDYRCTMCRECHRVTEDDIVDGEEIVSLRLSKRRALLTIESAGQVEPLAILQAALEIIEAKAKQVEHRFTNKTVGGELIEGEEAEAEAEAEEEEEGDVEMG
ncbi:hypothetical protein KIPB_014845, partial [Kipferlia bialata]